jgi:hypothetical protein
VRKPPPIAITAMGCEHISITGPGVLDGDCRAWTSREDQYYLYKKHGEDKRPFMFMPIGCKAVTLRDITIKYAPVWTVVPRGCDDVLIEGIRIYNSLKMPNSDAIDIVSCRNVRILGCHIEAGDDCICLKTYCEDEYADPSCDGVVVSGCTLVSTSSALVIGCEVFGTIRNVVFNNCVIRNSNRGLSINLSKECNVENVIFSDIIMQTRLFDEKWWGHGEAVKISAIPWLEDDRIGHVRNVTLRNLTCEAENAILVYGWQPGLIRDILFDNVSLRIDRSSKWPGGELDLRPTPQDGAGFKAGIVKHPLSGFMIKNAENVTLRNCRVEFTERARATGEFFHALAYDNAPGLAVEGFKGEAAGPALASVAEARIHKPLDE